MPELPEVQTIVNDLNKKVIDEQIVGFESVWKNNVRPSFSVFTKKVKGAKVVGARRIGKHIILDLDNRYSIVIHLKMTGHLLYKSKIKYQKSKCNSKLKIIKTKECDYFDEKVNQYIRHKFLFKSGATLEFSDLRKFGWLSLVKTDRVGDEKEIKKLGIDALDKNFTLKVFKEILDKKKGGVIGTILLDQELIAGIGNIYRSEILFEAGVNPKRKIATLSDEDVKKIFDEIKKVFKKAIKYRGTSDSDYRDTDGKPGNFQKVLKVYQREGERCIGCPGFVKRDKLGQRSIFFCPKCQK